ncbi:MAG: hypothetical protein CL927_19775 [Deltaproteobacteria bacterium]|nr:hypothetical protein [Deltaproteobacteria bacterium]HCH66630.1 hypothetical protein [Deltaproteobacteria bacterium]
MPSANLKSEIHALLEQVARLEAELATIEGALDQRLYAFDAFGAEDEVFDMLDMLDAAPDGETSSPDIGAIEARFRALSAQHPPNRYHPDACDEATAILERIELLIRKSVDEIHEDVDRSTILGTDPVWLQEQVRQYLQAMRALGRGSFTGALAGVVHAAEDKASLLALQDLTGGHDQQLSIDHIRANSKAYQEQAMQWADDWWEANQGEAVGIGEQTDLQVDNQSEAYEDSGRTAAYFLQIYFDAAKAQKRLSHISDVLESESDIDGLKASMPNIKGILRATEKTGVFDGDAAREDAFNSEHVDTSVRTLRDMARGTIEVARVQDLQGALDAFLKQAAESCPGAKITRFRNKFRKYPKGDGYYDLQMHIRLDGGHICEMQFNCAAFLDFKMMNDGRDNKPEYSWDTILGDHKGLLESVARQVAELEATQPLGEPPDDAKHSMERFAAALASQTAAPGTDGHWPLCSHFLYNITRWLKKKRKTLEQGEVPPLVDRVISGLDDLSAKASKSFLKRIAASEGITDVDALMAIAQAVEPDLSMWETK